MTDETPEGPRLPDHVIATHRALQAVEKWGPRFRWIIILGVSIIAFAAGYVIGALW